MVNNIINIFQTTNICLNEEPPGCTNPPNVNKNTAFLDMVVSISLMGRNAVRKKGTIQEKNHTLGTPSKTTIVITETLELLLSKYQGQQEKRFGFQTFLTN